jgi:hypothetical protein
MRYLYLLLSVLSPATCLAFFCPTNFSQINTGDSIETVIATCGKPDSQTTKEEPPPSAQEWVYLVPQAVPMNTNQNGQGTLKTTVDFDQTGKAINITVNGIGVGATTICNNNTIQLGSTPDQVKTACGQPSFINQQGAAGATTVQPKKITTLIYNTNPPQTLTFEDGKLTSSN